jgi:predicted dehydrogenase
MIGSIPPRNLEMPIMPARLNRRRFLQSTAAIGAAGFSATWLRAADKPKEKISPNEKLHIAMVGTAAQASYSWGELRNIKNAEIVALCDVHESRTGPARQAFPKATFDVDFRKMLDRKGIDAVVVATPDHVHAPASLAALRSGRHVYCEKPLTHTVYEARLVAETAAKHKRVTQMGTQIHAGSNYRRVVELVQSGAIGPVNEVHVWCGKSWGGGERPTTTPPVPPDLHWDLWLGPAPERPYHPDYMPFIWRKWWDFGSGTLGDMACHYMDLPFWALKLRHPTRVEASGTPLSPETCAVSLTVNYEFPARDDQPAVKLSWYDGGRRPEIFKSGKLPRWGDGVLFVGSKGMLIADYGNHRLLPEKDFAGFKAPEPFIPNSIGHHREWVEACLKGEPTTTCDFHYSGALSEAVLLGNVAYRLGKPLDWDAKALKATNEPDAEKFIRKEYRKGWEIA